MILTLFLKGVYPYYTVFFVTHFLICHSFLDSYIRHNLRAKREGGIGGRFNSEWAGQGGRVAQYP